MDHRPSYTPLSFRFRRWTRKAWAVFSSLGCLVTIGTLRGNMAGQSLVKLHLPFEMLVGGESREDKEEEEEIIEVQLKDVELLPSFMVAPAGAQACFFIPVFSAVGTVIPVSTAFFIEYIINNVSLKY